MARIRTIKPELASHEGLFDLERETGLPIRFAWCMLFTVADREGRFKWQPRTLKAQILPHDELDFSRVLDAWVTRGFVVKYRVNDTWYGCIPTFKKHQVINNRESASDIPSLEQANQVIQSVDACTTRENTVSDASITREVHAQGEGKGRERKEGKGPTREARDVSAPLSEQTEAEKMDGYARVMVAYPKVERWFNGELAERNCHQRIERNGETWETLEHRAAAYRAHCESGGVSGPAGVRSPDKFFEGDKGPWSFDWQPVTSGNGAPDPVITWRPSSDEDEEAHHAIG